MENQKLFLGMATRGDALVTSIPAKDNTLIPGDLVKISADSSDNTKSLVEKVSSSTDCIYGVVTHGNIDGIVPVVIRGHVLAHVDSTVYSDAKVGSCFNKNCVLLVKKMTGLKANGTEESSAYEVKI